MILVGLTGSIAMGKSHVVRAFRAYGIPVFDADAAVHRLFLPGGSAVLPVLHAFPGSGSVQAGVDRRELGRMVVGNKNALRRLERIVHPLVRGSERRFLERQCRSGRRLVVLDIPLLLETGGEALVDRVAVVSAHPELQRQRALRRPAMTPEKLGAIRTKQMPEYEKRRRADFLIPSGFDRGTTVAAVSAIMRELWRVEPAAWPHRWLAQSRGGGE